MKKEHGLLPRRVEGVGESRWILMDYLDVIVHIFTPEAREFYRLEQLWGEAPKRIVAVAPPPARKAARAPFAVEPPGSNRDLVTASHALSQLSYSPDASAGVGYRELLVAYVPTPARSCRSARATSLRGRAEIVTAALWPIARS